MSGRASCGGVLFTFSQHALFGFDIVLEVGCCHPDFDALADVLDGIGEDDFGVLVILKLSSARGEERPVYTTVHVNEQLPTKRPRFSDTARILP